MTRRDMDMAVAWAAMEGWNPGIHDAESFFAADSNGFFIGEVDREPVATLSAVSYGDRFGFLGFYIVKPEHRGKGFGMQIWNAGLGWLQGRNVGLDGVVAQQDNYKKSGFKLAYRNVRYEGRGGGHLSADGGLQPLTALPFQAIEAYDRPFFPEERSRFLSAWIFQPQSTALGVVKNGSIEGYGVIRPCQRGFKIGPLMADTPEVAETLFLALKAGVPPSEPVYLDVPEVNREAVALATRHQMDVVFETARMYTGDAPEISLDRLYGVTSFELG
ncbi:GNAT family N-acetyltransferase [Desulfoluna butyratoxydans]|nr:GNAT family N-acetyltransferase [Desulfoluna butyratoxydans]